MAGFLFAPCTKQLPLDALRCFLRGEMICCARCISTQKLTPRQEFVHCHRVLGVKVGSSPEEIREAFLSLAKRYHPDGASPEADNDRFQEVEAAYRKLQLHLAEQKATADYNYQEGENEVVEYDIQHTAPQHRQYLSFDGFGAGTPAQREKQHRKLRALRATENVFEHRIKKLNEKNEEGLIIKDKIESKKIKTSDVVEEEWVKTAVVDEVPLEVMNRYGMDRLVEDLIQESMAKGDFDNLSGRGKPLQYRSPNPYVDFVTQKMNEVLIDNGFTPEWITLQKEIRIETQSLREKLQTVRAKLGPAPLDSADQASWEESLQDIGRDATALNSKINKYNLLVPILQKQMLLLPREAKNIIENGKFWPVGKERPKPIQSRIDNSNSWDIFGALTSLFGTK